MKSGGSVDTARALHPSTRQVLCYAMLARPLRTKLCDIVPMTGSFARSHRHLLASLLRYRLGHQARKTWRSLDGDAPSHILLICHGVWVHPACGCPARSERPPQVCHSVFGLDTRGHFFTFTEQNLLSRPSP